MTFRKVSVLVPTRNRLERLGRFIDSYKATVRDKDSAELVFRCDSDDLESVRYLAKYDWNVLVGPRLLGYRSLPSFYNDMARIATGDVLACGNDDMLFQTKDWPARVLEAANRYPDGIFNLGVNTGLNDDKYPFSIVSRKFNDALGFINDVRLLFSDVFIRDVMEQFSRNVRITNVTFFHEWAGHGAADQTRRDANAHEFDMVFADKEGNWTETYRTRHESAVAEAVAKITVVSDMGPSIVLANLAQYRPPEPVDRSKVWPPSASAAAWCSGDDRSNLHYHKDELIRLLRVIFRLPVARGTVVLAPLKSGPSAILWGQVFSKVVAIAQQKQRDAPILDGKYSVYSGSVGDSRFLYDVINGVDAPDCLILDDTQYWSLISPYYLFRRAMRRPGVVIFFRTPGISAEEDGMARFVHDLRTGTVDGICHELTDISTPGAPGICYELVE
jgi:hypothetical protein